MRRAFYGRKPKGRGVAVRYWPYGLWIWVIWLARLEKRWASSIQVANAASNLLDPRRPMAIYRVRSDKELAYSFHHQKSGKITCIRVRFISQIVF